MTPADWWMAAAVMLLAAATASVVVPAWSTARAEQLARRRYVLLVDSLVSLHAIGPEVSTDRLRQFFYAVDVRDIAGGSEVYRSLVERALTPRDPATVRHAASDASLVEAARLARPQSRALPRKYVDSLVNSMPSDFVLLMEGADLAMWTLRDPVAARKLYGRAVEVVPTSEVARARMAWATAEVLHNVSNLDAILESMGVASVTRMFTVYDSLRLHDDPAELLRTAAGHMEDQPALGLANMAVAMWRMGRQREEVRLLFLSATEAATRDGDRTVVVGVYADYADWLIAIDEPEAALRALTEIGDHAASDSRVWMRRGWAELASGLPRDAMSSYLNAYRIGTARDQEVALRGMMAAEIQQRLPSSAEVRPAMAARAAMAAATVVAGEGDTGHRWHPEHGTTLRAM